MPGQRVLVEQHVAEQPAGAESELRIQDGPEQLVGAERALEDHVGLAGGGQLCGRVAGPVLGRGDRPCIGEGAKALRFDDPAGGVGLAHEDGSGDAGPGRYVQRGQGRQSRGAVRPGHGYGPGPAFPGCNLELCEGAHSSSGSHAFRPRHFGGKVAAGRAA